MASNIKPKPSGRESPTEPFKRAVTGCLRAIARKHELATDLGRLKAEGVQTGILRATLPRLGQSRSNQLSATLTELSGSSWPKQR